MTSLEMLEMRSATPGLHYQFRVVLGDERKIQRRYVNSASLPFLTGDNGWVDLGDDLVKNMVQAPNKHVSDWATRAVIQMLEEPVFGDDYFEPADEEDLVQDLVGDADE
jgi:hypothetical protein